MRYLGLDVGQKAIGVAVGEALSADLTTLKAAKDQSFYTSPGQLSASEQIKQLMKVEEADAIVVGLPVNEAGKPTEESQKIRQFAESLKDSLGVEIHFVDETLTSFMAEDMLASQGMDEAEIAEKVHQTAAALILQQYLEEHESI